MSSKQRREAQARADEAAFNRRWSNGLVQCLASEDGRAFLWMLYDRICMVENAEASKQRRAVGIDLAAAAKRASFSHWLLMREENERASVGGGNAEADEETEGEE